MSAPWDPAQGIDQWATWLEDREITPERSTDADEEIAKISFKGMSINSTIAVDVTFDKTTGVADFVEFVWDTGANDVCDLSVTSNKHRVQEVLEIFQPATE